MNDSIHPSKDQNIVANVCLKKIKNAVEIRKKMFFFNKLQVVQWGSEI